MKPLCVSIPLALLVCGCATMSPERSAELQRMAAQPIICEKGQDCEIKWGRSILWITRNSHWKLRQQTDQLITTEGPFDTTDAAFTVNKVPIGNDRYQIVMDCWCGNLFGCIPDLLSLKADFTQFVLQQPAGLAPSPAASSPTISQGKPVLGIRFMNLPFAWMRKQKGILVVAVTPGSVASSAGLRSGDVIYEFNGVPVPTVRDFQAAFGSHITPGQAIPIKIFRSNQEIELTAQFEGQT